LARRRDEIGTLARQLTSSPLPRGLLSQREIEVLQLAANGLTNKEIGAHLTLSEHTIARHIANARNKLGAANRAEAVSRLAEMSRS
jgi:DNA-binding NarL/FixJ family response regulator